MTRILTLAALAAMGCACAFGQAPASAGLELSGKLTVITSDKLTFDYRKQFALFEGQVVVTDPEMKLQSDTMDVRFGKDNQVETILAEGNVRIEMGDKIAWAGKAIYDVAEGKVRLEVNPRVQRGQDVLEGTVITFWRDQNKMVCEPQARLVIYPAKGGTRTKVIGD